MKEIFETPDIYVIGFGYEDVITTSEEASEDEGPETPDISLNP